MLLLAACGRAATTVQGIVLNDQGPVAGARVRVQTSDAFIITGDDGTFTLALPAENASTRITAWAPGYYITASEPLISGVDPITLKLIRHHDQDNPEYKWVSAFASAGVEGNCQNCHSDSSGLLPFEEWRDDAHSQTLSNVRFRSMYQGTNLAGQASPPTRYGWNRDYGRFQLPPNSAEPYFGPGYKLDFPETAGNCAACHAPMAAINDPYQTDPLAVHGAAAEGISCDFCHKVWAVDLQTDRGLPNTNMPGVLSFDLRRPAGDHQFFAGPLDDVAPGEDTYSPIQTESAYCAPCHFGVFWDTTIYNSFGEWLASDYSDPEEGQTCQDCHMPARGTTHFAVADQGGLTRDPETIRSHRMLGITDPEFMRKAVSMEASADWSDEGISLSVTVTNDNTGHNFPSDSPLRNAILLVQAGDKTGQPLELLNGPSLPKWSGAEVNKTGHYAGQPGRMYALLLRERWTGISPTGAYWNPVQIVEDTRLAPFEVDRSSYTFQSPATGPAQINVKLIFRRAFAELAEQKGWGLEDLTLASAQINLEGPASE